MNNKMVTHYSSVRGASKALVARHLLPAVQSFLRSIYLSRRGGYTSLQDTLRLLMLWFRHVTFEHPEVVRELRVGFDVISIGNWLQVIPQLIARISSPHLHVSNLVQELLTKVGRGHPQALIYPLSVAAKSSVPRRRLEACILMEGLRRYVSVFALRLMYPPHGGPSQTLPRPRRADGACV